MHHVQKGCATQSAHEKEYSFFEKSVHTLHKSSVCRIIFSLSIRDDDSQEDCGPKDRQSHKTLWFVLQNGVRETFMQKTASALSVRSALHPSNHVACVMDYAVIWVIGQRQMHPNTTTKGQIQVTNSTINKARLALAKHYGCVEH